jgi:TolA-binding protein
VAGRKNDLLGRLADLGEDAIQRIGDVPGADRMLGAVNALRDRTDELQKRVRGLEGLEQRLADLERKVDKLSKGAASPSPSASRSTAKKATTTKSSSAKKPQ